LRGSGESLVGHRLYVGSDRLRNISREYMDFRGFPQKFPSDYLRATNGLIAFYPMGLAKLRPIHR